MAEYQNLSERESQILQYTVQNFIEQATPVGSDKLVDMYNLSISPATVRNVLHKLEKKGCLSQPHTSAGRIPTERGYRYYVNSLMSPEPLSLYEHQAMDQLKKILNKDFDDAVFQAAQLLARLSNMLALVVSPKLAKGVFKKLDLISVSSSRLLIVLTIKSGLVKTVNIEVEHELNRNQLDYVASILNERLSGYPMSEIASKVNEMLADKQAQDNTGLIRIFIDSADTIFAERPINKFYYGGAEYIALLPEFRDENKYRQILEMLENEELVIYLMDQVTSSENVSVHIGKENKLQQIEDCSVVSATYNIGEITGKVGLVGPTRMKYGKMVSLVDQLVNRFNQNIYKR